MAQYVLVNDDEPTDTLVVDATNHLEAMEKSLNHLGFRLEPKNENLNEIRTFYLVETDGTEYMKFKGYLYESSLLDSLDRLGYSVYNVEL
jgi:hypothetical protein